MSGAALPLAAAAIAALTLAGAYAMAAYAPAVTPHIVTVGGSGPASAVTAIDVAGIGAAILRGLRDRGASDSAWSGAFRVAVDQGGWAERLPPVIGRYEVRDDAIRFVPRFPFAGGVDYRVEVDLRALQAIAGVAPDGAARPVTHRFSMRARTPSRTTRVVAVHPSAERVPSNTLRWYVELSSPMEPGAALEHVRLLDEAGRPVEGAFLRLDEELWDPARKRLTLLFDPGRVKRGVRTNLESGAPLIAGRRYRLVIDAEWRDAAGAPLASGFDKEFEAVAADAASPDPARWRIDAPRAGTREPLRVAFGEPLDHALAMRMIAVEGGGSAVEGVVRLAEADSLWSFTPATPWRDAPYALVVDAALEDAAGNSIARVFDADRRRGAPGVEEAAAGGGWRRVEFVVRR